MANFDRIDIHETQHQEVVVNDPYKSTIPLQTKSHTNWITGLKKQTNVGTDNYPQTS